MIYRKQRAIDADKHEEIIWAIYKEFILFLDYFKLINMEEEIVNWRKISYYLMAIAPILITCLIMSISGAVYIINNLL